MPPVKWDPFRGVSALQDRINRLFDDAFPRNTEFEDEISLCKWRPAVDIFETDDSILLIAELPGIKKEDVSVEAKDNMIVIKGERRDESGIAEDSYLRRERLFGSFHRAFALQSTLQPDRIKAKFKDGLLEVQIAKPIEEQPKKITVDID